MRLIEEAYVEPPRTKKMNVETMEFDMVKDEHGTRPISASSNRRTCTFLKRYTLYALEL